MKFDLATMMIVGALLTATAGLLTVMAWVADRSARALLWWAAGYVAIAVGIVCLFAGNVDPRHPWTAFGNLLLILGPSLMWCGARVLHDQRPMILPAAAGPLVAFAAALSAMWGISPPAMNVIQFALTALYLALTVAALWRHSAVGLRLLVPLIAFVALHAAMFAIGFVEALMSLLPQKGLIGFAALFGMIHFEQMLFAMGSSIFLIALVRERSELRHKATATIDVLTGVATRRAFLDRARADMAACREEEAPLAMMMFDLDRFKRVNDSFGHAIGDQVLQAFALAARSRLRASDFIGRLGGEEFAVVMPRAGTRTAMVIADRIRRAFAECQVAAGGQNISATVSGGVAMADAEATLEQLLSSADAALYRAKANGRNRIELADGHEHEFAASVIRVA